MVNMQGLDAIEEIKLVQDTIHAIAATAGGIHKWHHKMGVRWLVQGR